MKLRYFLRGLGAGIVLTALVVGISGNAAPKETLTDNEIMARARELGMVTKDEMIDESLSQLMNNQQEENEVQDAVTENKAAEGYTEANTEDVSDGADGETEENAETATEETSDNSAEETEQGQTEEEIQVVYTVTVKKGMNSEEVSAALEKVGIIDDADAFNDYLCKNGYSSRIHVKTFTFTGKPSYEELAKILTGRRVSQ